jgi:DNA-binding HxlR family transcriptional regulator
VVVKTYAQTCPIAVALDAVGERWTLLILRELLMGDQRFTDLRANLRGIAPNLLSARLASLVERGYVVQAELPPPAARTVYRLTPRGREVGPVLRALSRFGAPELPPSSPSSSSSLPAVRAVHSLVVSWWTGAPVPAVRVAVDGEGFDLADAGRVRVRPADPSVTPVAVVSTTVAALLAARRDGAALSCSWAGPAWARAAFAAAFAVELDSAAPGPGRSPTGVAGEAVSGPGSGRSAGELD